MAIGRGREAGRTGGGEALEAEATEVGSGNIVIHLRTQGKHTGMHSERSEETHVAVAEDSGAGDVLLVAIAAMAVVLSE